MIDSKLTHEGFGVYLSDHAYQRLVERVYSGTTRDVLKPTLDLLQSAHFTTAAPSFLTEEANRTVTACWLMYDNAGVVFAMPLSLFEYRDRRKPARERGVSALLATTCMTPGGRWRSANRKGKTYSGGRKTKRRKTNY